MTQQQAHDWCRKQGYKQSPRTGNWHFTTELGSEMRYVISSHAMRRERKVVFTPTEYGYKPAAQWMRCTSNYLKDLEVNAAGELVGMKRGGCQLPAEQRQKPPTLEQRLAMED